MRQSLKQGSFLGTCIVCSSSCRDVDSHSWNCLARRECVSFSPKHPRKSMWYLKACLGLSQQCSWSNKKYHPQKPLRSCIFPGPLWLQYHFKTRGQWLLWSGPKCTPERAVSGEHRTGLFIYTANPHITGSRQATIWKPEIFEWSFVNSFIDSFSSVLAATENPAANTSSMHQQMYTDSPVRPFKRLVWI